MHFSKPRLHPPVLANPVHRDFVERAFLARPALQLRPALVGTASAAVIGIPLTTVSLSGTFDAYIDVRFSGSGVMAPVPCVFDSGNSVLIVPRWEDIAAIPNFAAQYRVLGTVNEPWGCPANVVQGPIVLVTDDSQSYTINNCVFYACTGDPPGGGDRTANFGAGCLSPWGASGWNTPVGINVTMQAPLSYDPAHPFAEVSYAPLAAVHQAGATPLIAGGSSLLLHTTVPPGYNMFSILASLEWMSLTASGLSIGAAMTGWPGTNPPAIAMIDTGGGPVFLNDPQGFVYRNQWPDPVANPDWTSNSVSCESTGNAIGVQVGDANGHFTIQIDPTLWPASVQGLTLVMCEAMEYMRGQYGLNVGGISALVNSILIDYQAGRVGFKSR